MRRIAGVVRAKALVGACVSLCVLVSGAVGGTGAGAVTTDATRSVPTSLPAGWYVWGATAPAPTDRATGGFTYYARRGQPTKGAALAVGSLSRAQGFAGLADRTPSPVRGLPNGRLARRGDFAWVTWLGDAEDTVRVVAGRGVSDDVLAGAARAARFPDGAVPTIAKGALPSGLTQLVADAGISPDAVYPAEHVTLVDATGDRRVTVDVYQATAAERAFTRFWVDQASRRTPDAGVPTRAVMGGDGDTVIVARGDAPLATLRSVVSATAPTDDAGWDVFRARVDDLPVAAFFPQVDRANGAVLDGATAGTRWAVGWDHGAANPSAWNMLLTADGTQGGGGLGLPDTGLPEVASSGTVLGHTGMLFAGVVPAAAATARFEPAGLPPVAATIGSLTPDGAHRYFAAFVPGLDGTSPLVVLDASGSVIATRARFGCNTCE